MTDAIAGGMESLLAPLLEQIESKLHSAAQSQQELKMELDRLTAQLEGYRHVTQHPSLKSTTDEIAETTKRLAAMDTTMTAVKARLSRILSVLAKQSQT